MKCPKSVLFAAIALPLFASTAEGEVRKCPGGIQPSTGSNVPLHVQELVAGVTIVRDSGAPGSEVEILLRSPTVRSPTTIPFVAVDGVLVDGSETNLDSMDILAMEVGCIMVQDGGRWVKYNGIAVVTRGGAVEFMRSYLDQVVVGQQAFRSVQGHYATDVLNLAFFASRPVFSSGIEMVVGDGRWTATMSFEDLETSCHVSGTIAGTDTVTRSVGRTARYPLRRDSPPIEVVCS
jgi:hypothetical protein